MSKFESERARQSLVPDFRFNLPTDLGDSQVKLAELKVINCYKTWYSPGAGGKVRTTDKGAGGLTTLYTKKARDVDQKIIGTPAGTRGSVETELSSMERSRVFASEHGEREAEMFMIWFMSLPSHD